MEYQKPIIRFYQKRSFGEKMSAAFDFMRDNFKLLFKLCVYLLLPLSLLQAIFMNTYLGNVMTISAMTGMGGINDYSFLSGMIGSFLGMFFIGLIASSILVALVFTCMQVYNETGNLKGLTFADLKEGIIRNFKKAIVITLILFVLLLIYYFIMILLILATPLTLLLTLPALVALAVAVFMVYPVYIFEDITLKEAIVKGTSLGFKTWGGLFGVIFVMGLLVGLVQGVASIPWYIVFVVKMVFSMSDPMGGMADSFGISILQYLTNVIMAFFAYVASILIYIVVAYHYSSASEEKEAISVNEDLRNFEDL